MHYNPPGSRLLRLYQIIGRPEKRDKNGSVINAAIPPLIPVGRSTFLDGVKNGIYPRSVKLGSKTTAWKFDEIMNFIDSTGDSEVKNE